CRNHWGQTGRELSVGRQSLRYFWPHTISQIACPRCARPTRELWFDQSIREHPMKPHWQNLDGSLMRATITIAIALFSATAAQGQSATRYVVSGHQLKLSFFNSTNPDCSSRGRSEVRLIRAPEHGRVSFRQTADFPSSRSQCHQRRVPGTAFYYQSQ